MEVHQPFCCFEHPPSGHIFHGRRTNGRFEPLGEKRTGHSRYRGQFLKSPALGGVTMDRDQRTADFFIGKSKRPPGNPAGVFRQVDPQSLNQNQGGEVLFHEAAAGSGGSKLTHQKIEGPMESRINYLFADVNDGRKEIEEDIGMVSRETKVSSKGQAISASV